MDGTVFKENASCVDICILFFFISGKEDNCRDCGNTSTIQKKASENHNSKEFNTSEFVSLSDELTHCHNRPARNFLPAPPVDHSEPKDVEG